MPLIASVWDPQSTQCYQVMIVDAHDFIENAGHLLITLFPKRTFPPSYPYNLANLKLLNRYGFRLYIPIVSLNLWKYSEGALPLYSTAQAHSERNAWFLETIS
jgi:hypothetical protein